MKMSLFRSLCAAALLTCATNASAGLIITEAVDGPLSGGNPKFVEITNTMATDYTFSGGGIVVQSNASADLDIDVDLTGVTIMAGQSYVIQSSANDGEAQFLATYGFDADLYTSAFFSNGDDRYILATADDGMGVATDIADILGDIDTDGTGTAWEYLDSYAFRNPGITAGNGGVFDISEWTIAAPNTFDGTDASFVASVTTPGSYGIPEPASAALALMGVAAIGLRRRNG